MNQKIYKAHTMSRSKITYHEHRMWMNSSFPNLLIKNPHLLNWIIIIYGNLVLHCIVYGFKHSVTLQQVDTRLSEIVLEGLLAKHKKLEA